MGEGLFQPWRILLLIGVAKLLFGPRKFADLGKGLGEGIRNFKQSVKTPDDNKDPRKTLTKKSRPLRALSTSATPTPSAARPR